MHLDNSLANQSSTKEHTEWHQKMTARYSRQVEQRVGNLQHYEQQVNVKKLYRDLQEYRKTTECQFIHGINSIFNNIMYVCLASSVG